MTDFTVHGEFFGASVPDLAAINSEDAWATSAHNDGKPRTHPFTRYSYRFLRMVHVHGTHTLDVFDEREPHVVHSVAWKEDDPPEFDGLCWDLRKLKGSWYLIGGTMDSELKNFVNIRYLCLRANTYIGGGYLAPFLFGQY